MQKRYVGARHPHQSLPIPDCLELIHKRSQAIDAMSEWMFQGGGAQDVLDDPQLFNTIRAFLDHSTHHAAPSSSALDNFEVQKEWSAYEQSRLSFSASFNSQTMRPTSRDVISFKPTISNNRNRNLGKEPPDIDHIDPEQLVDSLDAMAAAAFSNVTEEVCAYIC